MLRFQNKSQVAFEFVVLIAVLFTALIVFTVFVRDNFSAAQSDTDYFLVVVFGSRDQLIPIERQML